MHAASICNIRLQVVVRQTRSCLHGQAEAERGGRFLAPMFELLKLMGELGPIPRRRGRGRGLAHGLPRAHASGPVRSLLQMSTFRVNGSPAFRA